MVLLILRAGARRSGVTTIAATGRPSWLEHSLTAQGLHTVEHLVQWAQYNLLYWTMRQSNGLALTGQCGWGPFYVENWRRDCTAVLLMLGGCAAAGCGRR